MNINQIINEYPEDYCQMLSLAYGKGMMSEGGSQAIEAMFDGISLAQKKCLDVGFGLGGVASYLAQQHQAIVSGIEINPRMIKLANAGIASECDQALSFHGYHQFPIMPFANSYFDIVYSKGVLVQLKEKQASFDEMYRVLTVGGKLVIDDWLSPPSGEWSERIKLMSQIENLSLFATTEKNYRALLEKAGFKNIIMNNVSQQYSEYNFYIIKRLYEQEISKTYQLSYGKKAWQEALQSYQLIAETMAQNELLVTHIRAEK